MSYNEYVDRDGDGLAITHQADGVWITCAAGENDLTVGPFDVTVLTRALAAPDRPLTPSF